MMNVIANRRALNKDPLRQVSGNTARELKRRKSEGWRCTLVIPALDRSRQED